MAFWRAYTEILNERVPLVDRWRDGSVTWHPRVVQKLLWYSNVPNTMRNREIAYDWLMRNAARPVELPKSSNPEKNVKFDPLSSEFVDGVSAKKGAKHIASL